jgi:D-alanyl-D-alanine carboxypeptidase
MHASLKKSTFLVVFFATLVLATNVFSSQSPAPAVPLPDYTIESAPAPVSALSYLVFDATTGEVLIAKEPDTVRPAASVTKLLTAATLVQNEDLEQVGTIEWSDLNTEGRAGKLEVSDKYTYRELLFPLLLESSNDAAAFFERETAGAIVAEMNSLAESIGMQNSSFVDASGLSDRNQSTATDLRALLTHVATNVPYVLDITTLPQHVGTYTGWVNNSPVRDSGYLGGKHGYTTAANRTLAALFEETFASESRTVGYVLLGSADLAKDTAILRSFVHESVRYE